MLDASAGRDVGADCLKDWRVFGEMRRLFNVLAKKLLPGVIVGVGHDRGRLFVVGVPRLFKRLV